VDVRPALERWRSSNIGISIYSAGSVFAQKLLFEHVSSGDPEDPKAIIDARTYVSEWIDTSLGGVKTSSESYVKVVEMLREMRGRVLFLSDSLEELRAAREAGLKVSLVNRPGNPEVRLTEDDRIWLDIIESFDEIQLLSRPGEAEADVVNEQTQRKEDAVSHLENEELDENPRRSFGIHKTNGEEVSEDHQPARKKQSSRRAGTEVSLAKERSTVRVQKVINCNHC
jgi:beta-phosphoglucomutase-like phosphatase (HAD superfamily)